MTDTPAIEHLREMNIRLSERVEMLELELIRGRSEVNALSRELCRITGRSPDWGSLVKSTGFPEHHWASDYCLRFVRAI